MFFVALCKKTPAGKYNRRVLLLFVDFFSYFFNAHFRERSFFCKIAFFAQFKNMNIILKRIGINIYEFRIGQGFRKSYGFLLILAVVAVYSACFRVHSCCDKCVNIIFFTDWTEKKFRRCGANNNGSFSVFGVEYGINIFLLVFPEFHRHFFAVNESEKRKTSAFELVTETKKEKYQIKQKPGGE